MLDEPRRHPLFLLSLALLALGTVPLPFVASGSILVFGIPLWLIWSLGFTASLSALTSWGILYLWRDPEMESEDDMESEKAP